MLDKLFLQILNMSFTAIFVILFVLIARLFLKKSPKIFSYTLWSVVLFRLVCPFSFESMFSLLPTKANPISQDIVYIKVPMIDTGISAINNAVNSTLPAAIPYASINPMQVYVFLGRVTWLVGIAFLLIYSIISLLKLQKRLRNSTHERDNIYIAKQLNTPFVMGIIRPKIYLPTVLTDEEKQYILLHEQTHIRRLDHIVKILSFVVLCVHWFNPLVWVAFFLCGKDMEMSCDETVIKKLGSEVKKDYSSSLLTLATGKRIVGGTPLTFGEGNTKGRIRNVLNYREPAFWVIVVTVIAVVVVGVGLMTSPKDKEEGIAGVNAIILEIDKENQTMTVEGIDKNSVIGDKCILTWEKNSFITVTTSSEPKRISLDDFSIGDYVVLFIGEVQESYPTRAKARTIQLQPKEVYSLEGLWLSRTKYVGDNSAVGNIISGLSFPENLKHYDFELHTAGHPYGITVNFKTDTQTRNSYTGALNEAPFKRNAIIMFSLIENAEQISFTLDDSKNPYSIDYTRAWAEDFMEEKQLFKRSETFDDFGEFAKEISVKISNRIEDDIKNQQLQTNQENLSFWIKPDEPAQVIGDAAAHIWLKSYMGYGVPAKSLISNYKITDINVITDQPKAGVKWEDMKYHYVAHINYNITTATEEYFASGDDVAGKGSFDGLFRELCIKSLGGGNFEIVSTGTGGGEH